MPIRSVRRGDGWVGGGSVGNDRWVGDDESVEVCAGREGGGGEEKLGGGAEDEDLGRLAMV